MAWNYGTNTEVPLDPNQTLPAIDTTKLNWVTQIQKKPVVDVREFGAKGDGITDDTIAIQKAFDYAVSLTSATVLFPVGIFIISNPGLLLAPASSSTLVYINLEGMGGAWGVHLRYVSTTGTALTISNNLRCSYSNILIDTGLNTPNVGTTGLWTKSLYAPGDAAGNATWKGLYINGFDVGWHIGTSDDHSAASILVLTAEFLYNNTGVLIEGPNTNDIYFKNLHGYHNYSALLDYLGYDGLGSIISIDGGYHGRTGASTSTDFILRKGGILNVTNWHSEPTSGEADGRLLQVGPDDPNDAIDIPSYVNLSNITAWYGYGARDGYSIILNSPVDINIANSRIGIGKLLLSGKGGTSKSRLQLQNSSIAQNFITDTQVEWDTQNPTTWLVSQEGGRWRPTTSYDALKDGKWLYTTDGLVHTLTEYLWNEATSSMVDWTKFSAIYLHSTNGEIGYKTFPLDPTNGDVGIIDHYNTSSGTNYDRVLDLIARSADVATRSIVRIATQPVGASGVETNTIFASDKIDFKPTLHLNTKGTTNPAPSYTVVDGDSAILQMYNLGSPYTRYLDIVTNSLDATAGSAIRCMVKPSGTNPPADAFNINGADGKIYIKLPLQFVPTLVEYADNAAALTAGLVSGQVYRTGDLVKVVH